MTDERDRVRRLQIGDLVLDTGRRRVTRGDEELDLPKLSYRLLLVLADAAPNMLTQDELVERVWPGLVISPETVSQRIKLTRRALGDDASQPRYIGVVRGEGYRLLADIRELPPAKGESPVETPVAVAEPRRQLAPLIVAGIALLAVLTLLIWMRPNPEEPQRLADTAAAATGAIAVLPFANASENPDDLYISEGLGDELRDQLGRIAEFRVAARSSSVVFRNPSIDATAIADQLRVTTLIEGQVRRQGDRLRVTVQIIDGESGFQTWSQSFDRDTDDLIGMQQEIAAEIVAQLLPDRDRASSMATPASLDASANELMYLARYHFQDVRAQSIVDVEKLRKAIDLYRQATQADPESALAHARLGAALLYLGDVEAAEEPIFRAVSIDPDMAETQYTLGLYRWMRFLPGSGDAFQRAIEIKPFDPDANEAYGKWVWHQMMVDRAEPYLLRALEMDPASLNRYADLGSFYGMSGMRDQALDIATQVLSRFDNAAAYLLVARIYELAGDMDVAIAWAHRAHALDPTNRESGWMLAELYARIGDFDRSREFEEGRAFNLLYWERRYEDLIAYGEELALEQQDQPQLWYGLARAYIATGRYDQAVHVLHARDIPRHVFSENRRASGLEAIVTLADAHYARGDTARARELAGWMRGQLDRMIATGADDYWWQHLYAACVRSILGDDAGALDSLEAMSRANGVPWYPLLLDSACFRRFENERRYQGVISAVDEQMHRFRRQLPDTLRRFRIDVP